MDPPEAARTAPLRKSSLSNRLFHRLPPWVRSNLNRSSFKLLARSWIASWIAFLLIIPPRTLNTFGNAGFFACMSSFLIPPAFPIQAFFYAMALMVFGSLLGWAWGCAAMKAALGARDHVLLLSELERAQRTAATGANPEAIFKLEIFQGTFLDTGSSIVYGIFFAIGCFFFAISRAYSQKLMLFSVFGTIFLDIICSYGPLFPAADYMILQSLLTSTAAYVAIGCATVILFFPSSLNHQMLGGMSKLFVALRQQMEIQEQVLTLTDVDDLDSDSTILTQILDMTAGTYGGLQKLVAGAPLLSVEFSFGRFNGEDVKNFVEPLTILISRMAGLQNFSKLVGGEKSFSATQSFGSPPSVSTKPPPSSDGPSEDGDGYLLQHLGAEKNSQHSTILLKDVLPLLHNATADLRTACIQALRATEAFITHVNTTRWRHGTKPAPDLNVPLDALRLAMDTFMQNHRLEVVEPYVGLGPLKQDGCALPQRALFYALVFQANLGWCAEAILQLLEVLVETAQKRPRARLWAPKSMRFPWKILKMRYLGERAELDDAVLSTDLETVGGARMADDRDPDSSPPTNFVQHIGDHIYRIYKWCTTHEAIYAFKYTFVSVALWLPGVFRSSAYTNYVDKGIWAIIMAQTTIEPFMADQIYSYFARLTATTAGIAIGLVVWYVGAGHGEGNPYGVAAAMGVALVPLMFWRIFCPSVIPPMLCSITVLLIVGYSWIDSHLLLVGNPGVGWAVAWRRWLLVLIGSGASAIIMFIPPKSARKAVRLANASMILELSQLYSALISHWIVVEQGTVGDEMQQQRRMSRWSRQFRADFSSAGARIQALNVRTNLAQWEGSIRGVWAADKYLQLNKVETEMLSYLAQLAGAVYHLDSEWRARLRHQTKFLNPNFIAEVMSVFTLISRSLKTGQPLEETLPRSLVDRVFYHHGLTAHLPACNDGGDTHVEQLRSLEFMTFATGVTAVYKILSLLDCLHEITVELCGQVRMQGFAEWEKTYNSNHICNEAAMGCSLCS